MNTSFNSIIDIFQLLPNETAAHKHLATIRWKHGIYCPHCGSARKIHNFSDGIRYKCADCRKQFTVRIGTIFQDSPISLRKWIIAIWLMTSHRKGCPATQIERELKVSYKTAWFMLHRIRGAFGTTMDGLQLSGIVEVDETYIGGKEKNKHKQKKTHHTQGRSLKTKEAVIGMKQHTVIHNVLKPVKSGSVLATDEYNAYNRLGGLYHHVKVNHSVGEYVNGMASTNGIESFWALLKRGYIGMYHFMSAKHLGRYVDEFSTRFNMPARLNNGERYNLIIDNIACGKLAWKDLV